MNSSWRVPDEPLPWYGQAVGSLYPKARSLGFCRGRMVWLGQVLLPSRQALALLLV